MNAVFGPEAGINLNVILEDDGELEEKRLACFILRVYVGLNPGVIAGQVGVDDDDCIPCVYDVYCGRR